MSAVCMCGVCKGESCEGRIDTRLCAGPRTAVGTGGHVTPLPSVVPSSPNGDVHDRARFFISALPYARALRSRGHHPRKPPCRPPRSLPVPPANGRSAPLPRFWILCGRVGHHPRGPARATGRCGKQPPGVPPFGAAHARWEGRFWIAAARRWRSDEQSEDQQ